MPGNKEISSSKLLYKKPRIIIFSTSLYSWKTKIFYDSP